jgi:hypothetical protein
VRRDHGAKRSMLQVHDLRHHQRLQLTPGDNQRVAHPAP